MLAEDTLTELATGLALHLALKIDPAKHVAWREAGGYEDGEVPIFLAHVPDAPDRQISLWPRPMSQHPTLVDSEYAVQTRYRGTPDARTVWGIRDAVRPVLGTWPVTLPNGLYIACITFDSGTTMGRDKANRVEWADNWTLKLGERRARP